MGKDELKTVEVWEEKILEGAEKSSEFLNELEAPCVRMRNR